ncbi:platelet-derived growth factor receptor beta-like isoform X2 [Anopheles stephensi]|uniref:platelet-derived growth factor receptor beta-like isoform X2 n=1 Tax=Anopheles stephensi TaxID=30069 RepID=UPI001658B590|nr:platelet-derived growth factor receptor beta-like isoform X2 [Anopheles stephensi]
MNLIHLLCQSDGLANPKIELSFIPCKSQLWHDCRARKVKLKLEFEELQEKHLPNVLSLLPGILICDVSSEQGVKSTETVLQTSTSIESATTTYLIMLILVIVFACIVILIMIYITCVYKKSSRRKQVFKGNGFNGDQPLSTEEIYAKVYQFRREKVQLVEKIEKGEYGVYWRAIVTGVAGDPTTEIEVMAKEAVEKYDRETVLDELKSYIHVGHHVNVLNLLGIVTENINHGELFLITEYCRFGNLKTFLRQNSYAFRDDNSDALFVYDSG